MLADDDVAQFVQAVLREDLGAGGDVTSAAVIPQSARFFGEMVSREPMVVAGLPVAQAFFRALDPTCLVDLCMQDGAQVEAGAKILTVEGMARALLAAERSALNIVQTLSGMATLTRRYVDAVAGTGAIVLDTRKTLPGLRLFSKYATRAGGAQNHRLRLDDGILIKDNHIAVAGGVAAAVAAAQAANTGLPIQVECDTLVQVEQALGAGADRLLLDNMSLDTLRACVARVAGRIPLEASGGVRLETIRAIAETGVTYISVGRLTQSASAVDIGLDFAETRSV